MQIKLDFELPHGAESLTIQILDNPGATAWYRYCRDKLPSERTMRLQGCISIQEQCTLHREHRLWLTQQKIQSVLGSTTKPLPWPVHEPDKISQQHLNVWHRWFTDGTHSQPNDEQSKIEYFWLHELNQIVHELEADIVSEWPKTQLGYQGSDLNVDTEKNSHGTGLVDFFDLTDYRQYHSWDHADIILDQAVHGKTTLQSFLDNDDPRHWDTTGHYLSWGGFKLASSNYKNKIYTGSLFSEWMQRHNVSHEDLWGDYPLGNIVNRDQAQLDRIFIYKSSQNFGKARLTFIDS